jgi:hypothetical protein
LAVRFEDGKTRAVVKALILEKFSNRTALIHSITETRGADGTREWYKEGKLNRGGNLPAIECADGTRYWYKEGELHRDGDKPAVKYPNGTREWYKDGVKYTPKSK